jgi:hypothetical protein
MSRWRTFGRLTAGVAVAFAASATVSLPVRAGTYQVGFLIDESASISTEDWTLMMGGLSSAIGQFVGQPNAYELTVTLFSTDARTIINKQIVTSASLPALRATLQSAAQAAGETNLYQGFVDITQAMNPTGGTYSGSYINLATDGEPNLPTPGSNPLLQAISARDEAIEAGIDNISIEGIGDLAGDIFLTDAICYPQTCDTVPPPTGFPGTGFFLPEADGSAYAQAISAEIGSIIDSTSHTSSTDVPEPRSILVFGSGIIGVGLFVHRRRQLARQTGRLDDRYSVA